MLSGLSVNPLCPRMEAEDHSLQPAHFGRIGAKYIKTPPKKSSSRFADVCPRRGWRCDRRSPCGLCAKGGGSTFSPRTTRPPDFRAVRASRSPLCSQGESSPTRRNRTDTKQQPSVSSIMCDGSSVVHKVYELALLFTQFYSRITQWPRN